MPLDPQFASKLDGDMRRVLEALDALGPAPIETLSPQQARQQPSLGDAARAMLKREGKDPDAPIDIDTRDFDIPGPLQPIRARLYSPKAYKPEEAKKPLPVLVFYHGGGWVIGDLDGADAAARALAKMTDCLVVSCDYRLAPEHRFPSAHMDAYAAYAWVAENAKSLGGDPKNVAVAGESAGANLAINVAMLARESQTKDTQIVGQPTHKPSPLPVYMVLVYPVAGVDMNTPSYKENADAVPLSRARMEWFLKTATETDGDRMDPRLDLQSANLSGLPDATVILAELDPLLSEGQALATKLEDAGSEVRSHLFKGVPHAFFGLGRVVKKAYAAQEMAAHNLKRAFGTALLPL